MSHFASLESTRASRGEAWGPRGVRGETPQQARGWEIGTCSIGDGMRKMSSGFGVTALGCIAHAHTEMCITPIPRSLLPLSYTRLRSSFARHARLLCSTPPAKLAKCPPRVSARAVRARLGTDGLLADGGGRR